MFGNLLNIAAGVIPQQEVYWRRFLSRTQDAEGNWVNTYAGPELVTGSFQPVSSESAKEKGFDITKTYMILYTSHDVQKLQRGTSPDQILYMGDTYDVMDYKGDDWYAQDGWRAVYVVKVSI